ncbi:SigE family RNA polymerase sigma factor [Actinacidiphila rubida]|uniref:RNA polymerase sigma-70 factor, sigma-E family n=1 Tax=Actinacidiphila rubida TaxID=310780 RepID=A0A1H8UCC1_9ACTN|nr:SigE family RNA polymerase sigma factor [Actinacidiphila rubida]SEO63191.1 RNA polymerase sigma-70 factor, sigma-E family [Actinacidiphila rubida]SEP00533.1 RNA polymerase sigma-70 factor, sigma-E family [Actinacidiphila rubida]
MSPTAEEAKVTFDAFVTTRGPTLLRTAFLLTRDWGKAEDLLQTALAKAYPRWKQIEEFPEPYVRRILVTSYATWWRRRWRHELPSGDFWDGERLPAVEDFAERYATRALVLRLIGELSPAQQAVVVLRYYEGLSVAETAYCLNRSVDTVKTQSSRALAKLRAHPELLKAFTGAAS